MISGLSQIFQSAGVQFSSAGHMNSWLLKYCSDCSH